MENQICIGWKKKQNPIYQHNFKNAWYVELSQTKFYEHVHLLAALWAEAH